MTHKPLPSTRWTDPFVDHFLRFAAGGYIPASWFEKNLPSKENRAARTGKLNIEIVSHCWKYSHFLIYQLSSLVNYPPQKCSVTMTVFYCEEDLKTVDLLNYFGAMDIPNITWNWQALPRPELFHRGIGRNYAARDTKADWIWFTDCDLMFHENCLDTLNELIQGRQDALVFPQIERCTSLLENNDPMLSIDTAKHLLVDIETDSFTESYPTRATGPLQITHGDVARACGYCESLGVYQTPSDTWQKAIEDRAFRWLIQSKGKPLNIPGVYRIRHVMKGRYTGSHVSSDLRSRIRLLTDKKSLKDGLGGFFYRFAASGFLPASWFRDVDPNTVNKAKRTGKLKLEMVCHCWNYGHLLTYQLSSLINHRTDKFDITMTVFHAEEDETVKPVFAFFEKFDIPGITWNWQTLPKEQLFRRSIGRNMAAKKSTADWVWFTDCDIVFHENCLDTLADELQGRDDALVFPERESSTSLLSEDADLLAKGRQTPELREISLDEFTPLGGVRDKAKGAYQITHGDIARACGYCETIGLYQQPSDRWRKTYEDRAFRWLIDSHGVGLDIPNVCQIRHIVKGRYKKDTLFSKIRTFIRKVQD